MDASSFDVVSATSAPSTVILSASDPGNSSRFKRTESVPSEVSVGSQSSQHSRQLSIKQNYLLGKRKRPLMKDSVVVPAIEELAPCPNAPACRVCHVSLGELADTFKHTGSALKKRKLHPPKKRISMDSYSLASPSQLFFFYLGEEEEKWSG